MLDPEYKVVHLGLDICGTVVGIGADVSTLAVGNQVLVHGFMKKPYGGFAEYSLQDPTTCVLLPEILPEGVDVSSLAASPCAAWTAYRTLFEKLRIPKIIGIDTLESNRTDASSLTLAIIGASGGVGSYAIQLAKLAGVGNIIAVCSTANVEYCRQLGATNVIDYKTEGIYDGE